MSVRREKRRSRDGAEKWYWTVDFVFQHADGRMQRVRKYLPVSKRRGAEAYERELRQCLLRGAEKSNAKVCPSFKDFFEVFIETYAATNNKVFERVAKRSILDNHLLPSFGGFTIDKIDEECIERYKAERIHLSNKTVNNHLGVLLKILITAYE